MAAIPLPPENVLAIPLSSTSIRITWVNTDIYPSDLWVQRRVYGDPYYETIHTLYYPSTQYDDEDCEKNTHYQYRIVPSGYEESDPDDTWTYPGTITELVAETVPGTNTVALSWTNDGTYSHVRVYYKLSSEPTTWTYVDVTFRASYTVTGLTENAEYDFEVAAREADSSLVGEVSNEETDTTDVLPPTGLALEATANDEITLTWTDNSSVEDGYEIYRSEDGVDFDLIHTTAADVETYVDDDDGGGLTPTQEYWYYVRAKDGAVYSEPTDTESLVAGTPPGDPTSLAATKIDHDGIALAWTNADSTDTGIEIYRSLDGSEYELVHTTAAHAEAYNDTGLDADTLYYYRVRAVNDSGNSGFSNADSDTTDVYIVAPTGVSAEAQSDTQVLVEFTNNSETVDYHEVYRRLTGGAYGPDPVGVCTDEDYLDGTCNAEKTYFYKVRDNYDGATGPFSDEAEVTTPSGGSASGTRSETYFGLGNELCLQVDGMQGVRYIDSQVITKPMDFSDQDPQAHRRIKTVSLVVVEYEDLSADFPLTVGVSTDDGESYTEVSRTVGTGDRTQKSVEFRFAPISSEYFKFRLRSNDDDTDFAITAIYIYYDIGGPAFEVE